MREKIRLAHIPVAVLPLALAPALLFALAEDWINVGGGEKDIVLVLPYAIWSLALLVSAVVRIARHPPLWSWVRRASGIAFLSLLAIAGVVYSFSWLGIG